MNARTDNPVEALERVFHEPNRLAIMSAVCAAGRGVTFSDLKTACGLTDGNLNRHLKVLVQAGGVRIEKSFVKDRPRTTVYVTAAGLRRFNEYLAALTRVLQRAKQSLADSAERRTRPVPSARAVPA